MSSVKAILYKGKIFKNGSHPIMIRIIQDRLVRRISLGYSVEPKFWDDEKGFVLSNHPNCNSLNSLIKQKIGEAEKEKIRLESDNESFSVDELLSKIKKTKPKQSFFTYTENLINEMMSAKQIGNADIYGTTLRFVKSYSNKPDLQFSQVDYNFIKNLETFYLSREGNKINGLSVYMRTLRAIYNRAIKDGVVNQKYYPFALYKIKNTKTIKRAISKDDLIKIKNLELIEGTPIWHSKNFFFFSFFMIGMSWVDLANLKVRNINNDRIFYKRAKTGKEYSIKIIENISEILNYYCTGKKADDYIFPIIKRPDNPVETRKDVKNSCHTYNKYLKQIAEQLGITANLTSYVTRHTWASIAYLDNHALGIIKDGLGHDDAKTTQTYLSDFNYSDIDNANELISKL